MLSQSVYEVVCFTAIVFFFFLRERESSKLMKIFTHNYSLQLGSRPWPWHFDLATMRRSGLVFSGGRFVLATSHPESWALNPNAHMAHHLAWTSPPTQRNVGQPLHCPIPSSQSNLGITGRGVEELVLAALFLKYPVSGVRKEHAV